MIHLNSKLTGVGNSIFSVMSALSQEHDAINLSQGFPDFECDPALIEMVNKAIKEGHNQYAPMAGTLQLRELIAEKTERLYQSQYSPDSEITITAGGTQAIFTALTACINPR